MKYLVIDNCPVPDKLAPFLTEVLREAGASLNSCYRGADAESLLHRLGKHSQTELYEGFIHRKPGFLPANPPGYSTHELRNDGFAYAVPRGARLEWWQVGIDVNDSRVDAVIAAAERRGWKLNRTYPTSKAEYHHLNFRKPPLAWRTKVKVKKVVKKVVSYKRPTGLSAKGADFIARFEGVELRPYDDPSGYATIGVGHLLHRSRVTDADQRKWGTITRARALELLRQDAEVASSSVRKHVKAKLNQAQFDALVSFVFNVGTGAFESSTLLQKLNTHPGTILGVTGAQALDEVRSELLRWDTSAGHELPGLKTRRQAEGRLFATGRYA